MFRDERSLLGESKGVLGSGFRSGEYRLLDFKMKDSLNTEIRQIRGKDPLSTS